MTIKSIAVYCSASDRVAPKYKEAAKQVGHLLAKESIRLVYGGGDTGLMKIVSDACMEAKGQVLGVMTEYLEDFEDLNLNITELRIEKCMHSRKKKMFLEADGFLVLPGGLGTLDEIFEVLTWKQIDLHTKPIVFLNQDGFWDPLIPLMDTMIQEKTAPVWTKDLYSIVSDVGDILKGFRNSIQASHNSHNKW
ncbi:MAG: Rossman fold protein, TIGR00730 family [Alphaproteobacteria bacterium RIFCSPLOWO2_01_FULL_45_8]|nr:MAG: Rossman fold protein, TIGR00730 family [Alphaproteobacteria bacterium GWB1_45_5]OFW89316.1 MAG: Rossman fold protein, TIGR00730 family [Alphaproteobacteria bacterium RIFCSPHIGHO2_01_FULL_41_14]OFW95912.1 MAG: Rossman fold protein, TIGR00730 family [Alphaproteobacteria bacterium RIFCSPLOWO2_01_FULL_45_8]